MTSYTGRSSRHRFHHRRNRRAWLAMAQISVLMDARSFRGSATNFITWDVTIPDTLAQSHLPKTSCVSGAVAEDASLRKIAKYTGEIRFRSHRSRDPGTQWMRMGIIFCWRLAGGYRQYRVTPRNQLPSSKGFCNTSTLQRHRLSRQFQRIEGFWMAEI